MRQHPTDIQRTTTETLRLATSISGHTRRPGPTTLRAYPLPESRHRPCTCRSDGEERLVSRTAWKRTRREGRHKIRSAWRVKLPNLCEEKTMVLFPRSARSLSNKSGNGGDERTDGRSGGDRRDVPCSARGSSEALGSSKRRRPTEDSVSETSERMNIRELVWIENDKKTATGTMSVTCARGMV